VSSFTGRDAELALLDDLLLVPMSDADDSTAMVVSAVSGAGGVGKTALAIRWAHHVGHRFADGQLYINLRGFDPQQPIRPGEALTRMLNALGVGGTDIPLDEDERAARYRTAIADRHILIVLDNAASPEQVRPLLPGTPGSMALVTSRNQLAGLVATDPAHPVRLDVLDPAEARLLLTRRLGADRVAAEPAAVDQIIAACAGLPLALAIVTARVATRPGFPLAGFAAELADARDRLDALAGPDAATDVRAVFACSYRALSRPAARLFRLLGPHPGPDLGLPAAASLAATPPAQVRRLLAELTAAHLLTEPTPGRYTFHDLLRTYATELADSVDPATEQREAIHRALDYYLHSANAADRWLPSSRERITLPQPQPGSVPECFASNAEARRWLTVELPVLAAAVRHGGEAGFDRHVQQLACALAIFLLWGGLWHHHFEIQEAGLRAARRLADQSAEAIIHRNIAHAHVQLGRHDDAHRHIRKALALYQALGDDAGQARVQFGLTWLAEQQDRYQDGLHHAQRCLAAAELAGHRVLQALARNAVGWCHTLLGDHKQAIRHCEQALAELSELDEPGGMADVWNSLGRAHQQLGNHQAAIGYYRQAVDRCREIGSPGREATHLTHLGDAYEASGDAAAAREAWQAALELFDEIGHPDTDELRKRLE
jgi:tetratricopeptide (TPR) repeat protein